MTKSRRNIYKKSANKTKKNNKIIFTKKKQFIQDILKEWKKQTYGHYERDKMTIYEDDYYLSFKKKDDYYNHIHLILKNFKNNHNSNNNIIYVMKKMDTKNKNGSVHSKVIKISIFSNPEKVVSNMIKKYEEFYNI
jgi:hypothetical protein